MPGGLSKFQLKDVRNVMEEAADCGITLPLAEQVTNRYQRLVDEMDGADLDHAALYLELLNQQ